jgi:hypothetical protein
VAGVYAALLDDIHDGGHRAPDFADAVRLGHLIGDITVSAAEGRTVTATSQWPGSASTAE